MKKRRIYFGILIWVAILTAGIVAFRHMPAGKMAYSLARSKKVMLYLERDSIPVSVTFPRTFLRTLDKKHIKYLKKGPASEEFVDLLSQRGIEIAYSSQIRVLEKNRQWLIQDEYYSQHFALLAEDDGLRIYREIYLVTDDALNFWNGKTYIVIGRVRKKVANSQKCEVLVEVFPDKAYLLNEEARFFYYKDTGTFNEIVDNLLSGENGEKIKKEVQQVLERKKDKILRIITPAAQDIVEASLPHVREGLTRALAKRRGKITAMIKTKLLEKKLIPAIQEQLWPIMEKKAPPVLEPIAEELWNELPIAGIISREMLYKIYLSKKSGRDRFNEYINKKALPIINKNQDKLVKLVKDIAGELSNKEEVIQALQEGTADVFSDSEFKKILQDVMMEGVIKNQKLQDTFVKRWDSLGNAFAEITAEMEDPIRRIGDFILLKDGDYRKGINPSLARVLRQQILWKDTQWLQVKPGPGNKRLQPHMKFRGKLP